MSKNEFDDFSEEEYVFPDENEYSASESDLSDQSDDEEGAASIASSDEVDSSSMTSKNIYERYVEKFPILANKKLISIIVALIVVTLFFQLSSIHSSSKSTVVQGPTVDQQQLTALKKLNEQITSLSSSQQKMQASISSLQSKVTSLKSSPSSSSSSSSTSTQRSMMRSINTISASVKSLSSKVNDIETNVSKSASTSVSKASVPSVTAASVGTVSAQQPLVTFYIRSVEPGRAWVEGTNHAYMSVSVGDEVGQYGKVTSINSTGGKIYTTSGRVIVFGKNDA